jgi:hypothetical protein
MNIGRILSSARGGMGSTASRAGRAANSMSNSPIGKIGMGALAVGAMGAGAISGSGEIMNSAMDVAFDDPQADRAFVGTDVGIGTILGSSIGGPIGGMAKAPLYQNAVAMQGGGVLAAGGAGAAALGAGTMAAGLGIAGAAYGMQGLARRMPIPGGGSFSSKGVKAGLITAGVGLGATLLGGGVAAGGGAAIAGGLQEETRRQNPFANTTRGTSSRLNISGDIVLGAHNSRRGY